MNRGTELSPGRARRRWAAAAWAAAGVVVAVGTARLLVQVATSGVRVRGAARPDDLLLVGLAGLGVALALWLAVGSALALLALVPGAVGRLAIAVADRVTPLAVRKLLTLLLGASVGSLALPPAPVSSAGTAPVAARGHGGATSEANASLSSLPGPGFSPSATPDPGGRAAAGATALGPGFRPTADPTHPASPGAPAAIVPAGDAADAATKDATAGGERPAALSPAFRPSAPVRVADVEQGRLLAPSPRPSAVSHSSVTVRRGDTLWSIAHRHLGPDASDADVARAWPRWYEANREVIGADPDLLVPGLQLVPPGPRTPSTGAISTPRHLVPKE